MPDQFGGCFTMSKADAVPSTTRRHLLAVGALAPVTNVTGAAAYHPDAEILDLERRMLEADRQWDEHALLLDRLETAARRGRGPAIELDGLEAEVRDLSDQIMQLRDELVAGVPATLDGIAVLLRRLFESAVTSSINPDIDARAARLALLAIEQITGRPQLRPLRTDAEARL